LKKILLLAFILLVGCQPATGTASLPPVTGTSIPPILTDTPTVPPAITDTPQPPPTVPASVVELDGAEVQPGFSLIKFADLYRPTGIAFDPSGRMYVTSQDGNVYLLTDEDSDGRADTRMNFAVGYNFPLGIALHPVSGDVYLSYQGAIAVLTDSDGDDRADRERILVDDLPVGKHQNDNLKFGPDGWLYIGVGSACDACEDADPRSAAILRFNVENGESEIFATGLRNPFDLAFHPETGQLFATDNGRDDLGMDAPFEELNHIVQGGDYGYPNCWNEQDQPGCEDSFPPVAFFEAHSSANGVDVYDGQNFPAEYRGNAFVSIFGSWLKSGVQTGIQRVVLSPDGDAYNSETSWFVRLPPGVMPLPLVFGPDDALYVGDYINDAIYRISYGMP
jgi:putative membrane-bound dehydrogenase-like protein